MRGPARGVRAHDFCKIAVFIKLLNIKKYYMKHITQIFLLVLAVRGAAFSQTYDVKVCVNLACNGAAVSDMGLSPIILPGGVIDPVLGNDGCYLYAQIPVGTDISVGPFKSNDNSLNGVNALDLVKISKHILGIQPLNSPYSMIAADANRSGSITTFDIVEEKKLIQGIYSELPNNTSWRFIDADFVFPNPDNPFQTVLPGIKSTSGGSPDTTIIFSFFAIKTGDVDCSVQPGFQSGADDRSAVMLHLPEAVLLPGETTDIALRMREAGEWLAFQMSLNLDPALLEIESVTPGHLSGMSASSVAQPQPGTLNLVWFEAMPQVILPDDNLVVLRVRARTQTRLSEAISLDTKQIHPEIYTSGEEMRGLQLEFTGDGATHSSNAIFAPQPNPATAGTSVSLRLEKAETVSMVVTDLSGRQIWSYDAVLDAGAHLVEVPATVFPCAGVYAWRVQAGETSSAGKVVKCE